ncbi:hypothetical protein VNO77_42080 [Canavalia gladiata]|uniref:Uncharacterized protein n=1 Tax=Canavalia gladiata TaxID=3824 RepID=A0AAN9K209_CANGL
MIIAQRLRTSFKANPLSISSIVALGRPQDMFSDTAIQLQPVFAQWIQNTHALAPGITAPGATASTSLTWGGDNLVKRNQGKNDYSSKTKDII